MEDWTCPDAREKATWDFCKRMRDNPDERERCKNDRGHAKACFARNWFYLEGDPNADKIPIPSGVEFRIYDVEPISKRDEIVTIVLPDVDDPQSAMSLEDVWRCTWTPYVALTSD